MTPTFEWQFSGWLRGLPAAEAWGILAFAAVAGLVLVIWLYRRTFRQLRPAARNTLTIFRTVIVLLLLLCLANPARVEKEKPSAPGKRTLAVVVDRSASMSQPDYRRATRLADAVHAWKQHEAEAGATFSDTKFFWFATELHPAASLADAVQADEPGPETHLYSALRQTLDTHPDAIVCLTDGLDTTGDAADELVNEAMRQNVPIYFVVGMNHLTASSADEVARIREVSVPPKVLRQSRFSASAVFEVASPKNLQLPAELWSGGRKLGATELQIRPGHNTVPWTVDTDAGESGIMPLEFRLGSSNQMVTAVRTVRVVNATGMNVLYYEGALQWGYRFLRDALESDPSFNLTVVLNPALGFQIVGQGTSQDTMPDLPDDAAQLKRFQVVVLANVFANQLSSRQQQALSDYVHGGGGVLFISPDTAATVAYSGSTLEEMLPVVFQSRPPETPDLQLETHFQQQMVSLWGADNSAETAFAQAEVQRQTIPTLSPFAPGSDAAGTKLFQAGPDAPQYATYARVARVKPGAEVIAVTGFDPARRWEVPAVLVARQRFGDGFAAALNTDMLWRWKMSLPSTNREAEIFWQQFLMSLAGNISSPGSGLQLIIKTESPATRHAVEFQIAGSLAAAPVVDAKSPGGAFQRLTVTPASDTNGPAWETRFIPVEEGSWLVQASDADGNVAQNSLTVTAQAQNPQTLELMNLPPDAEGLRRLAETTGGTVIGEAPVFQAMQPQEDNPPKLALARPLWDTRWLAGLLLGLYGAELVVRRIFRLL